MTGIAEEKKDLPLYTWLEIRKHNTDTDCWVVLYGNVLDVTSWLNEHPGGLDPIKDLGGYDITASFEAIGHSLKATNIWKTLIIGKVDPNSKEPPIVRKQIKDDVPISEFRANTGTPLWVDLAPYVAGFILLVAFCYYFF